ncbi:hypothetical protein BG003_011541 [Podila horticola]|nr:hypothetical protein BG003_011541 [Podila horticola]
MSHPSDQYRYGRSYSRGPSFSTTVSTISRTTTTTTVSTTTTTTPNPGTATMGTKKTNSRNVGLCFFSQGPRNKLDDLDMDKLMHDHPVIVHQCDYRFEVYGQPRDVAVAITQGFFWLKENNQIRDNENDDKEDEEDHTSSPNDTLGDPGEDGSRSQNRSQAQTNRLRQESVNLSSLINFDTSPVPPTLDEEDTFIFVAPTPLSHEIHYGDFNESRLRRRPIPTIDTWKTDYDLHMDRIEHVPHQNHYRPKKQGAPSLKEPSDPEKKQNNKNNKLAIPDPYALVLSMPTRIMQYLLYETGCLRTYLVEQPSLRDCYLKGYSVQELEKVALGAGLVVGFNTTRMLPKSTDLAMTLECEDLEALRVVLYGIATAFAAPPLYDKILESLSPTNRERRSQWDKKLKVVTEARERDMSSDDQWVITRDIPDHHHHNNNSSSTRSTTVEVEFEPQETVWSYTDEAELPAQRMVPHTPPPEVEEWYSSEGPIDGTDGVPTRRMSGEWGRSSSSTDTIDARHERNRIPLPISRPQIASRNHSGTWVQTHLREMYDNIHVVKTHGSRRRAGEAKTPGESESANSFFAD